MIRTFKYRVYANKETIDKAEKWLELCRNLYNCALEQRIITYHQYNKSMYCFDQMKQLPELRSSFPEYKNIDAQTLQNVMERLDRTYKVFYKRVKMSDDKGGFPRFKSKSRYHSFTLKHNGWKLEGNRLVVRNVGIFKIKLSRPIEGKIQTITLKRVLDGKWYVLFNCREVSNKLLPKSEKVVGLDIGIKSFLTDSDGNHIDNPRFFKNTLKELRIKHRAVTRTSNGSNRRKKINLQLHKCYDRINNQRRDFHHKLANRYIKDFGVIVFEKLMIEKMKKNKYISRDVYDCAWGDFFEYLIYKAEDAGRIIIKDNPQNTSKMCHACGVINKDLKWSDIKWVCSNCGTVHDRDENAAINHKNEGIRYLSGVGQTPQAQTKEDTLSVACESLNQGMSSHGCATLINKKERVCE